MKASELRSACLGFEGAVEEFPFGPDTSVFKVAGKMFDLNKRHWNTVEVAGVPAKLLRDMIEDSYDLVVAALPRRTREQLGWAPASG